MSQEVDLGGLENIWTPRKSSVSSYIFEKLFCSTGWWGKAWQRDANEPKFTFLQCPRQLSIACGVFTVYSYKTWVHEEAVVKYLDTPWKIISIAWNSFENPGESQKSARRKQWLEKIYDRYGEWYSISVCVPGDAQDSMFLPLNPL